jgi:nicotinamide riboside transporter PnuC
VIYLTWIISFFALIGVVLNIKKKSVCFVIWFFTNTAWCVIDAIKGIPAQSALFAVYTALAVWGIYEWRKVK